MQGKISTFTLLVLASLAGILIAGAIARSALQVIVQAVERPFG